MKGKIAFVLGAAVGYVLGARAGRERYEQIKRGAEKVWNTDTVQRGVGMVKGATQSRVDDLKAKATRAGKNAVAGLIGADTSSQRPASPKSAATEADPAGESS